jgi:hypothetical protein
MFYTVITSPDPLGQAAEKGGDVMDEPCEKCGELKRSDMGVQIDLIKVENEPVKMTFRDMRLEGNKVYPAPLIETGVVSYRLTEYAPSEETGLCNACSQVDLIGLIMSESEMRRTGYGIEPH